MSELQIPFEALRDQINSAIDVIVQLDRFADGRRRRVEIAVVASQPPRDVPARVGDGLRRRADRPRPPGHGRAPPPAAAEPIDARLMLAGVAVPSSSPRCPDGAAVERIGGMTSATYAAAAAGGLRRRRRSACGSCCPRSRSAELALRGAGRRRGERQAQPAAGARHPLPAHADRPAHGRLVGRHGVKLHAVRADCLVSRCRGPHARALAGCSPPRSAMVLAIARRRRRRPRLDRRSAATARRVRRPAARPGAAAVQRPAAGLSMPQAVRMASRELADPGGAELKQVIEEMQARPLVEDALEALSVRLPSREVSC